MIIPLTPKDLSDYLGTEQLKALRSHALAPGQPDPVPGVIHDVCLRINTELGCVYDSSQTPGVPEQTKDAACHLCIEALLARIPGAEISEKQRRSADQARSYIRHITNGKVRPTSTAARSISVERKRLGASTREQLKGL